MSESEWTEIRGGDEFKFENEGDSVEGELVNVRSDVGENKSMMYDIKTENGLKAIWGSKILDEKMRVVKLGQKVKIVFKGKEKAKTGGREYLVYEVFVKQEGQ